MTKTNETRTPTIETMVQTVPSARLALSFSNGQQLAIDVDSLSDEIRMQATLHGLKQKLVDAAAISRDPATGRSATVDDKYQAVREVYDRLLSGSWNAIRGDGEGNTGGLLLAALARIQPAKTLSQLREWLETKTADEKAALRKNPKVASVIIDIQAERAKTSGIDTDAMLDQLGDE